MKTFTDLEQSRKLTEILPLESADMHYGNFSPKGLGYEYEFRVGLTSYVKEIKVYEELKESYKIKDYNGIVAWRVIPCWSLAALLDNIPQVKLDSIKEYNKKFWRCCAYFASDWHNSDWCDNPVDACYEMILELNELNLL